MSSKTIAFFGASGGCGLAALRLAVGNNHTCIALCRNPDKLSAVFPSNPPNLHLVKGNAHDADVVASCLVNPNDPSRLVDMLCFTVGSVFNFTKLTTDDPHVCEKSMDALFKALATLRQQGKQGSPLLAVISTTGISRFQRDVPIAFLPMYKALHVPHMDKKVMEERLEASSERWIAVRPSLLINGAIPDRKIRVHIEDPIKGIEQKEVGYTISREDVGRWMYENLIVGETKQYEGKAVGLTW
ncbi:NAD(P)-binding domain [Fusarium albosuccineum]|uniref:NAD(P)-binding domain n=1 Tax=Fusarium albosuccineum TaxID=1237068 RepID=A0A8H4PII9_9HYPO|nr:NAD(P)-binding domain [Fusarium albosuccineum]